MQTLPDLPGDKGDNRFYLPVFPDSKMKSSRNVNGALSGPIKKSSHACLCILLSGLARFFGVCLSAVFGPGADRRF